MRENEFAARTETAEALFAWIAHLRKAIEQGAPPGHPDGREDDLIAALKEACEEASVENWDGSGGKPVSPEAYERAERFLRTIPKRYEAPDIYAHPDGEIALEWFHGPRRVFTVAVGRDSTISYAGLFGENRVSGRELFKGAAVPAAVLGQLGRLNDDQEGNG